MDSQQTQPHPPPTLTPKKSPGRPPKLKPIPAQPTSQAQVGEAQLVKKRGRPPKQHQLQQQQLPDYEVKPEERRRSGRPPKQAVPFDRPALDPGSVVVKRRVGRPPKGAVAGPGRSGRPRGRPKKSGVLGPVSRPLMGKRPRGRPRKLGGGGLVAAMGMVVGKRRGRPPKGSTPRKPRRLSGKPLGRPRKDASAARSTYKQGIANEELMTKLELIQIKVRAAVGMIRPYVANENAALMVLQKLEELVTPNITAPPAAPPQVPEPVSLADDPSLTARPTDPATGATTTTGTAAPAPALAPMAAPGPGPFFGVPGSFSVNLPALDMTAPLHMPPGMESQPPLSWVPSSGTQS